MSVNHLFLLPLPSKNNNCNTPSFEFNKKKRDRENNNDNAIGNDDDKSSSNGNNKYWNMNWNCLLKSTTGSMTRDISITNVDLITIAETNSTTKTETLTISD